ncbi:biotin--[acetyl-CoA-carboxylase] ligase [Jatrophihabitans telluris]|uniref:biotin--[biotin carboxyl-carrier protein] ligase n=1 Tax=Jatrophihabitans telluris TaxID=2038343 RepID=A0ABY4R2U7_9ACTN|nr:biotin--[acetyl-CoA-carboxylase] ligase [Jatrophihabitans telluris]UQX89491.1 biotin--[acetyl-CoA-carboxylase] ligase [Jatrophihabitans telluris]
MPNLRDPLDGGQLGELAGPSWRLRTVGETGSTNADVLALAQAGEAAGLVLVAELQHAGRGRLDRGWQSPPGAGLTFSLLLRPRPDRPRWGWLPLLAGLALARAVGDQARLKWPNDLLVMPSGGKAAGILVQSASETAAMLAGSQAGRPAAVVGIGVNVSTRRDELPVPTATSLDLEGVELARRHSGRQELLLTFLDQFRLVYTTWEEAGGDAERSGVAEDYRARSATVNTLVRAELPGETIEGTATGIDSDGRLLIGVSGSGRSGDSAGSIRAIGAGDITHLRAPSR